jgi:hypothetical protein
MRPTALTTPFLLLAALAASSALVADECEHSRPIDAELDAAGASRLLIESEAGSLVVEGSRGAGKVTIEGRACASSESLLDDIELETGRKGDRLVVETEIPEWTSGWRGYARLDLTVTVPGDLALEVRDGSGEIDVRGVASLDLVDGSGEIRVREVYGDVEIEDGSGEIDVRDVTGTVTLTDGSGSVTVADVDGVRFDSDGSGEIELDRIRGDVVIVSDGSGGIRIQDVTGHVRIGSDGSGSISVAQVSGGFELGSDGSGSVHVADIAGTISIP